MRYLNCHLARKLDGYEVRLGAIRAEEEEAVGRELGAFRGMWNGNWELGTDCQNVSASWSCRHSGPNPNLNEDTDHLARCPMSGHGSTGGLLTVFSSPKVTFLLKEAFASLCWLNCTRTIVNKEDALGSGGRDIRRQRTELYG
jgi:hypothetical protein